MADLLSKMSMVASLKLEEAESYAWDCINLNKISNLECEHS